jgi:hypothetical protein
VWSLIAHNENNKHCNDMKEQILKLLEEGKKYEYSNEAIAGELLGLFSVNKRYFLFECVNADNQKLNKLIIATNKEDAIADIETSYLYIKRWYSIEELNVC